MAGKKGVIPTTPSGPLRCVVEGPNWSGCVDIYGEREGLIFVSNELEELIKRCGYPAKINRWQFRYAINSLVNFGEWRHVDTFTYIGEEPWVTRIKQYV